MSSKNESWSTATLVGMGLATGCMVLAGRGEDIGTGSASPQAEITAPDRDAAQVAHVANQTYWQFAGTDYQRDAGFVMRAWTFNHAMDECMESRGFPEWDWSESRQYASPVDPLSQGIWFAEPNRPVRSDLLMAEKERLLAEVSMNSDSIPPDEDAAIGQCLDDTEPASETGAERATQPPVASDLIEEWGDTVGAVAAKSADVSQYYACMDAAGIPVLEQTGPSSSELGEAISTLDLDDDEIPTSPTDPLADEAAWTDFLQEEKAVTNADWACRQDVYNAHIGDLKPVIATFADDHADEIAQARRAWAVVASEAEALGYTGQPGSLDR